MRLGWWLGRARRLAPTIAIGLVVWLLIKYHTCGNGCGKSSPTNPSPPPPTPEPLPNRWVITDRKYATGNVCSKALMFLPGWTVLIPGEKPNYVSHSKCVYFTAEMAEHIQQNIEDSKRLDLQLSLAYIFAIQNGAEVIYIPPNGGFPDSLSQPNIFPLYHYTGLVTNITNTRFYVASHFGCQDHDKLNQDQKSVTYKFCEQRTPPIQVPIVQFRMKNAGKLSCDPRAPPITVQNGVFVERFSVHGALYMKDAFWALPFPGLATNMLQHEMWCLIIQKLLWTAGQQLLVWHNEYNADTSVLINDQFNSLLKEASINSLYKLECVGKNDFQTCVNALLQVAHDDGHVTEDFLLYTNTWIEVLKHIDYQLPEVNGMEKSSHKCRNESVTFVPVNYSKHINKRPYNNRPYIPLTNSDNLTYLANRTCSKYQMPRDLRINFTHPWDQFDNVLLIVTYNNPHYEVIPWLEVMYRPFFPYILYCGPGMPNYTSPLLKNFTFSFVSYGSTPKGHFAGSFNYQCTTMAVNMHYTVEGYLVVADDILLAMYRLVELSRHHVWFLPTKDLRIGELLKLRECRLGMCDFYPHWRWWEDYQAQIVTMLNKLRKQQYKSDLIHRCYKQLVRETGAEMRAYGAYSDIYYIPRRLARDFATLATLFKKEMVFLEIAVPTIIKCLENPEDIQPLPGLVIWDEARDWPWLYFKFREMKLKSFMHPTKWGYLARGYQEYAKFFCTQVLPFVHDPYGRIR